MKKTGLLLVLLATVVTFAFTYEKGEIKTIEVGANMPSANAKMLATSGKSMTLTDLKQENGILIIFSCNTCPFVVGGKDNKGWEGRYNEVYNVAKENNIGMALINSNEARRGKGESMDDMIKRAKKEGLKASYLLDEGSVVADAFGARTTPHVFLFDSSNKLVYAGAIDDNVNDPKMVKEHWLKNAISRIAKGEKIDPAQTRQKGCSIKRVAN